MDAVEEVKSRLDIEQVVGQHVDLRRSGSGLKGLCPFHSEKTPSFFVFPGRGTFHCFGCGQGGDILTFVQAYEKVDFREALHRLADRAGIELPDEQLRRQQTEEHARLYQANEAAAEYFRDELKSPAGKRAVAYLANRSISIEAQHRFSLGYAPASLRGLQEALAKRGFSADELVEAGLVYPGDGTTPPRDRFHNRLMFPIRDAKGRITGFGGRILGDGEPKYLNSPQTEIFDKSRSLFAIEQATEPIRRSKRAVVVEGYIDAIRAHEAGFTDVMASLGTAITPQQLQICARIASTVVLALDPDAAGQTAAARTALAALSALPKRQRQLPDSQGRGMVSVGLSVDLRIARIPAGAGDPDELIARDPDAWNRVLEESIPAFEFYFDTIVSSTDRTEESWRQEMIDRIVPVIQEFGSAVGIQAAWIQRLADVTGVQPRLLQSQLPASAPPPRRRAGQKQATGQPLTHVVHKIIDPQEAAENSLLQILLRKPCPAEVAPALTDVHSARVAADELLQCCISQAGSGRRPTIAGVSEEGRTLAEKLLTVGVDDLPEHRLAPAIRLHMATLRLARIRRRQTDVQLLLSDMGEEDKETGRKALKLLLAERDDLEKQMDKLQHDVMIGV